jgi:hypothetical protein
VDPNAIPKLPPSSHAFWYEDPWVSSDLLGLLLLNAEPQRRGLTAQGRAPGGRATGRFPPDFDDRVMKLFFTGSRTGARSGAAGVKRACSGQ